MDLQDKIRILADAAKYDVSCSSSGSSRKNSRTGLGNASLSGICHSFTPDGRCISLLKILFTNYCIYDCSYCLNRVSNDIERAAFTPRELAELTINFYKRNYIEGLFLSSAIIKSADHTMELLCNTLDLLRNTYSFNGYIHVKAIPGADLRLVKRAGYLADRMSVNIELPSAASLKLLAPQKQPDAILKPMSYIYNERLDENNLQTLAKPRSKLFVPAGQSTQLIVGATNDSDFSILSLSEKLYRNFELKRVYYSAYIPVNSDPKLPAVITKPPLVREHRLYQADWLLRFYGFSTQELFAGGKMQLDDELDPKAQWALNNLHLFPAEINTAPLKLLLRIPGIGARSARKIVSARRISALSLDDLAKLGAAIKRARHFITCKGVYYGDKKFDEEILRAKLTGSAGRGKNFQLSLFEQTVEPCLPRDLSVLTGEF